MCMRHKLFAPGMAQGVLESFFESALRSCYSTTVGPIIHSFYRGNERMQEILLVATSYCSLGLEVGKTNGLVLHVETSV
jgi:hypothetical protein